MHFHFVEVVSHFLFDLPSYFETLLLKICQISTFKSLKSDQSKWRNVDFLEALTLEHLCSNRFYAIHDDRLWGSSFADDQMYYILVLIHIWLGLPILTDSIFFGGGGNCCPCGAAAPPPCAAAVPRCGPVAVRVCLSNMEFESDLRLIQVMMFLSYTVIICSSILYINLKTAKKMITCELWSHN